VLIVNLATAVLLYIRKRGFDEPLLSNEEILKEYSKPSQKVKKKNS
jgi:hypothetical protein